MAVNEFAAAVGNASENDKATLAQFVVEALARAGQIEGDEPAAKRLIVGAMDRYADEEGNA